MNEQIQRHLKRLALSERWDDLRVLLEEYVAENPNDPEANNELRRLNNGEPLRLMLSATEKKQAIANDAAKALSWLLDDHPLEELRHCNIEELRHIYSIFEQNERNIRNDKRQLSDNELLYKRTVKRRIKELSTRLRRKHTGKIILILGLCALIGGTRYAMKSRALEDCRQLTEALATPSYKKLIDAKHAANTKINLFFCPEIAFLLLDADKWIAQQENNFKEIDTLLTQIENREKSIIDFSPKELFYIETLITNCQIDRDSLSARWQDLCHRDYSEMQAHRDKIKRQIEQSLPTRPELTGNIQHDLPLVEEYISILKTRLNEAKNALRLYNISSDTASTVEKEIERYSLTIYSIKQVQTRLAQLKECRSYGAYCDVINKLNSADYDKFQPFLTIKEHLYPIQNITNEILARKAGCSTALFLAAKDVILNGAPSFPQAFPADISILSIPEDLFTAPSYQYKVYVLELSKDKKWYSTIKPELHPSNFITFRRSTIDPNFTPEDNYIEFQNDDTYQLSEIDATRLIRDLDIERNYFFVRKNIPILLTQVLNYPQGKHPALAQAYIYRCLLQLTESHPYPILTGVRFSPTLKKHAESFSRILKHHKITLTPGCWLSDDPAIIKAEAAFAEWFKTNKGHDYAAEMAENFKKNYSKTAVYCGYIDTEGSPFFIKTIEGGEQLYYISADGLCTEQDKALPLSPIFIMR